MLELSPLELLFAKEVLRLCPGTKLKDDFVGGAEAANPDPCIIAAETDSIAFLRPPLTWGLCAIWNSSSPSSTSSSRRELSDSRESRDVTEDAKDIEGGRTEDVAREDDREDRLDEMFRLR